MIQFKQVSKYFRDLKQSSPALVDITLEIQRNEFFGVIGASGSGKSTLLRLINQLEQTDSGEILIDGRNVASFTQQEQRKNRQKIGMIFQQFHLLNNQTVYQNVHLPLELQKQKNPQKILDMLDFVKIGELKNYYPQQLSGGQKQRVAIARALSFDPSILLCDEPTSALDEQHTEEIIQLLKEVQQIFQTTVVIVSHEFNVIRKLCQRAAVLDRGKLLDVIEVAPVVAEPMYESYYHRVLESLGK